MAVHRRLDIVALVALVVCVVAYTSFRSEFRLRARMPVGFFDGSRVPADERKSEERIASAYWRCAVTQVQWKYGYAHRLPDEPPDEFAVTTEEAGAAANDSVRRIRYWQRLREIWNVPDMWKEQYEWHPIALKDSLQSAGDWLGRLMRRTTG